MKHLFRLKDGNSSSGTNYDALPAAIAGFCIIQAFARHGGIGITPDSVVYMSTAANIHAHAAINDFTNLPMMDFPAFYPIFLSGIMALTGQNILSAGPILNGLLFAGLIWLCGWVMQRFPTPSKWYKWPMLLFIVLSPCLLEVYSMIWSETIFILLSLFFIIACHRYFQRHSIRSLLVAAMIAGLACVTRYAGVSMIAMGGLLMLCDGRLPFQKGSIAKKIGHMLLFGVVAITPLVVNLYRNRRLTGTLTGFREKAETTLGGNLHDFGSVFCDWLPFFRERYAAATLVAILFILLVTGIFIYRLARRQGFFSYDTIAMSYFIVYTIFILFSATVSRFQTLDSRLLSPLFLPWLWGSTSWIPGWLARTRSGSGIQRRPPWQRIVVIAVLSAASGSFIWGEWTTYKDNWSGINYAGIPGYTEDQWKLSPTMDWLRQNKESLQAGGPIYSNAFEGIWFLAGITSELIPHKDSPEDIGYMMKDAHFTVIWFDDAENEDLISIEYMRRRRTVVSERHFADGAIYFFTSAPPAPGH